MFKFILASASPRRKELLSQVGISFDIVVSSVEEIITTDVPCKVVEELSLQKAEDVFKKIDEDVIVIGADTVVAAEGQILGKPKDKADAFSMIKKIAGKSHSVYTGVTLCIRNNGLEEFITFSEETKVNVSEMSDEDINWYLSEPEYADKAGSYGIQGRFAAFVDGICGDYNNVVGLPVGRICKILREKNITV